MWKLDWNEETDERYLFEDRSGAVADEREAGPVDWQRDDGISS